MFRGHGTHATVELCDAASCGTICLRVEVMLCQWPLALAVAICRYAHTSDMFMCLTRRLDPDQEGAGAAAAGHPEQERHTGRAGVRAAERRHRPPLSAAAAMKALHIQNEVRCHGSWLLLPLLQSVRC